MANVKISELPNATSLSNGDSFPVVQGGVTKQAARSVLFASPTFTGTTTVDLLTATGDVTFDGGAFVFNESGADKDARFEGDTDANLLFLDASTDRVGIGTSTPAAKLDVDGAAIVRGFLTPTDAIKLGANTSAPSTTDAFIYRPADNTLAFGTASSERMRLDASGRLLVGTSSANISSARYACFNAPSGANVAGSFKSDGGAAAQVVEAWNSATTGNNVFVTFYTETSATARGEISYNRSSGLVAYGTTSDYRAKEIIGPVQNPGATIDALRVYEGVMKGATQSRPMLIAHETQAHAPYAVSGVKDDLNEDGTPKFQQMDVSSLVPLLLAELQSLRARVAALEAK